MENYFAISFALPQNTKLREVVHTHNCANEIIVYKPNDVNSIPFNLFYHFWIAKWKRRKDFVTFLFVECAVLCVVKIWKSNEQLARKFAALYLFMTRQILPCETWMEKFLLEIWQTKTPREMHNVKSLRLMNKTSSKWIKLKEFVSL